MIDHDPKRALRLMHQSVGSAAALCRHMPPRAFIMYVALGCCLFISVSASAAEYSSGLDSILGNYKGLASTWYTQIKGFAQNLFWLLVLVDFGWTAVIYALEKGDFSEIVTSLAKKMFTVGFFWALLKFSDTWIPAIIDSFTQIGTKVGGVGATSTTPDGIVKLGWEYASGAFEALNDLSLTDSIGAVIPVAVVALLIFMCFLFVSLTLMITLLESYLVIGAGIILLGFGGSRWTTDFATKYLQHAVGTGLKLMLIYLLIGAAANLFNNIAIDPDNLILSLFSLLGTAAAYAYFVLKIPQIASAMMSGSPALTTGDAMGTALAVGAAMAGVGAAGMAMGNAAAGGAGNVAAGATGLAKALGAGASSGLDMGKSGMDLASHAVGEVAKHGLGLGAGAIGSAASDAKTAFAEKVDNSTGGKIASGIEATRGGNMSGAAAPPSSSAATGGSEGLAVPPPSASDVPPAAGGAGAADGSAGTSGRAATPQIVDSSGKPISSDTGAAASASPATTGNAPTGSGSGVPPSGGGGDARGATGAVSPTTGTSNLGDASAASISGGKDPEPSPRRPTPTVSERIQGLQGYVPQDMAGSATINLDVKHTQD